MQEQPRFTVLDIHSNFETFAKMTRELKAICKASDLSQFFFNLRSKKLYKNPTPKPTNQTEKAHKTEQNRTR